ncbi:MAG: VWA domain-containing protein, partial [Pseudomonadota bacterium]
MFLSFFETLRAHRVSTTLREFLTFLEGLGLNIATYDINTFYHLARTTLVKDERHLDRFDQAFSATFSGLDQIDAGDMVEQMNLPEDWLRKLAEKTLSDAEKAEIDAVGGFDTLMETLKQRLKEQQSRHQGGSKWVGTAGTSPFGAYGYNPEGVRIGQHESRHRRAVKVWDKRDFKDLDDSRELGTRNIKVALKRLRRWARDGAADELDLPATIRKTAEAGYIDVQTRPERRNAVKVLLFLDVGGSMDPHIKVVEELFSAA